MVDTGGGNQCRQGYGKGDSWFLYTQTVSHIHIYTKQKYYIVYVCIVYANTLYILIYIHYIYIHYTYTIYTYTIYIHTIHINTLYINTLHYTYIHTILTPYRNF